MFDFLKPPYTFKKKIVGLLFGVGLFVVTILIGILLGSVLRILIPEFPIVIIIGLITSLGYVITALYFVIFFGLLAYDGFKNWGKNK